MTKIGENDKIELEKMLKSHLNPALRAKIMGSLAHYWEQQGIEKGKAQNIEIATLMIKEEKISMAKEMLKERLPVESIMKRTKLSEEQIEKYTKLSREETEKLNFYKNISCLLPKFIH